jgi:hypothetical protein
VKNSKGGKTGRSSDHLYIKYPEGHCLVEAIPGRHDNVKELHDLFIWAEGILLDRGRANETKIRIHAGTRVEIYGSIAAGMTEGRIKAGRSDTVALREWKAEPGQLFQ